MTSRGDRLSKYPSAEAFGREFMTAAEGESRGARQLVPRRWLVIPAVAAATVLAGGALAAALVSTDDDGGGTLSVPAGSTIGFLDRDTDAVLECDDGEPLTEIVGEDGLLPPGFTDPDGVFGGATGRAVVPKTLDSEEQVAALGRPRCSDGTTPDDFDRLLAEAKLGVVVIGG